MMVGGFGCGLCFIIITSCLLVIDGNMLLSIDMNENYVSVCNTGLRWTVWAYIHAASHDATFIWSSYYLCSNGCFIGKFYLVNRSTFR